MGLQVSITQIKAITKVSRLNKKNKNKKIKFKCSRVTKRNWITATRNKMMTKTLNMAAKEMLKLKMNKILRMPF